MRRRGRCGYGGPRWFWLAGPRVIPRVAGVPAGHAGGVGRASRCGVRRRICSRRSPTFERDVMPVGGGRCRAWMRAELCGDLRGRVRRGGRSTVAVSGDGVSGRTGAPGADVDRGRVRRRHTGAEDSDQAPGAAAGGRSTAAGRGPGSHPRGDGATVEAVGGVGLAARGAGRRRGPGQGSPWQVAYCLRHTPQITIRASTFSPAGRFRELWRMAYAACASEASMSMAIDQWCLSGGGGVMAER